MKIGCHVSNAGKEMLLGSVNEAFNYGANGFMVYLGAPQNSYRKNIEEMRIDDYQKRLKEFAIDPIDVIIHAPYIINLAQGDDEKRQFAIDFMTKEVKTTHAIGAKYIVIHPGAYLDLGLETGLLKIIDSLNQVLDNTKETDVVICLETMAGKGTECCFQYKQIQFILETMKSDRIKACLDTCHTNDSGYDWVNDYEGVIKQIKETIGLEAIKVIHLNDSKNPLGSKKDRHENIGFGNLGFTTLNKVCHDERFKDIMKILETPYIEGFPPYKFEIEMLKKGDFNPNLKDEVIAFNK